MTELMKTRCALTGPSGSDDAARELVLERAIPFADETRTDAIGDALG